MTRMPGSRHIGDGVYASHDGTNIVLETSDGVTVSNRIALEPEVLDGLEKYRRYAGEFYRTGQHRADPGCEACRRDITGPGPVSGHLDAEIYRIQRDGVEHEVRLCRECARDADGRLMEEILDRRRG